MARLISFRYRMGWFALFLLFVALLQHALLPSLAGDSKAAPSDSAWHQVRDKKGVQIFERRLPESGLMAFRGVGIVRAPLARLAAIMLDPANAPRWVDSCAEAHIVRRTGPYDYVMYNRIRTPIVLKDRDFVSALHVTVKPQAKSLVVDMKAVEDRLAPPTRHVRGVVVQGLFVLTTVDDPGPDAKPGAKATRLEAEMAVDPKGSVPMWLVNIFQQDWPVETFEGLRREAARTDFTAASDLAPLLRQLSSY